MPNYGGSYNYYAGDNYGRGSNYAAGGFFGSLVKGIGKVAGGILGLSPGGVIAKRAVNALIPTFSRPTPFIAPDVGSDVPKDYPGAIKKPGGGLERFLPGGASGYILGRKKRMNVANPKALRRAIRRQRGFIKLAKRALRGTGMSIGTRGRAIGTRGRGGKKR
jgi:hypothetical protein